MKSRFDNVPLDEGTSILLQKEEKLRGWDVLYQKWFWDGITAESIIFLSDDVSNLTDAEIEAEVRASRSIDGVVTLKRTESGFTFVNFNFEIE